MSSGSVLTVRSLSPTLAPRWSFVRSGSVKVGASSLGAAGVVSVGVVDGVVVCTGSVSVGVGVATIWDSGGWCHWLLHAVAEERNRRRDGDSDQEQERKCGDDPPPLDSPSAGLGTGAHLPSTHGDAVPFGVALRFRANRRRAPLLGELGRALAPVLVGDVAEPVVERLGVRLLPDSALRPATTHLVHVGKC